MKRNLLLIICCLLTLGWSTTVEAATGSLSITANSSVTINKNYDVTIKYKGTPMGSLGMKVVISNASCSIASSATGATSNTTSNGFDVQYSNVSGYGVVYYQDAAKKTKANNPTNYYTLVTTDMLKLSCKSSKTGTTKITASSVNGDAYDIEGIEEIAVSSGSKSITVNAATTTTTKKKTTTTTKKTSTTTKKQITTTTTRQTSNVVEHPTNPTLDMTTTTTTSEITTTSPIEENIEDIKDSYKLSSLKVVGYDFEFDKDKTGYHIEVHPSVEEVYILAEAVDLTKKIDNTGTINIKDKEEIVIRVYDEETNTGVSYKVLISRIKENSSPMYLLAVINGILALVIIALLFKNKNNGPKIEKYEEPKEKTKKKFEQTEEVKLVNEKKQYVVNAPLKTEEKEEDVVIDEDSIEIKPL